MAQDNCQGHARWPTDGAQVVKHKQLILTSLPLNCSWQSTDTAELRFTGRRFNQKENGLDWREHRIRQIHEDQRLSLSVYNSRFVSFFITINCCIYYIEA